MTSLTAMVPSRVRTPFTHVPGALWIVALFLIIASTINPFFGTANNLREIVIQCAVLGILACGTSLLLIAGLIDFAIGAEVSLVTAVTGSMLMAGDPLALCLAAGVLTGVAAAGLQGVVVAVFKVTPFIVSLGASTAYLGLALLVSSGRPFSIGNNLENYGLGSTFSIPNVVITLIVVALLFIVLLRCTRFGRHIYSLGGSERASFLAGIRVQRLKLLAYVIAGVTVGIAGITLMARAGTGSPTIGTGYELQALAAAVIGGTSFSGGRGTVAGTLIGVVLLISIGSLLALMNVSGSVTNVVTGAIVVVAAIVDQVRSGKLRLVNTLA